VFGVIILAAAAYYGWLFVKLVRVKPVEAAPAAVESKAVWYRSFDEALSAARESGKPIFVDVWSTWCKSCDAMERTTLKDPEVLARLDKYVLLKFQAEDPTDPEIKKVLDALGVLGQPFLVFLQTDKGSNDEN
jgi:thiol:disulfide interchange protein DsbD